MDLQKGLQRGRMVPRKARTSKKIQQDTRGEKMTDSKLGNRIEELSLKYLTAKEQLENAQRNYINLIEDLEKLSIKINLNQKLQKIQQTPGLEQIIKIKPTNQQAQQILQAIEQTTPKTGHLYHNSDNNITTYTNALMSIAHHTNGKHQQAQQILQEIKQTTPKTGHLYHNSDNNITTYTKAAMAWAL